MNQVIHLHIDTSQAMADLQLLAEVAECSSQLRQRLLDLGNLGAHLVCVDADGALALGANEFRVRLEFANGLAELVSAVRAGQFD